MYLGCGMLSIEKKSPILLIVNDIMKFHDYRETKKDYYGGEKSYVMAEMVPTSMAQYCIQ